MRTQIAVSPLPSLSVRLRSLAFAFSAVAAACLAISLAPVQVQAQVHVQRQNVLASRTAAVITTAPSADDAWLDKTRSLYYSSAKAGLRGFDCAVHPDWHALAISADDAPTADGNEMHLASLDTIKINLHAQMQGGSSLDWNQAFGKPLDANASNLLSKMHRTAEQSLEGFLQFWAPFVDGSVVPDSAAGLAITHSGALHTIHAEQGSTALTETFSNDLRLEHFDVNTNGTSIQFQPAYEPTDQGLLVRSFEASVRTADTPADQAQEMRVEIEYQHLDGFPIPSRLSMEVAHAEKLSFVLDGCTVSRLQRSEPAYTVRPALQ
ncbi:MAG TPA: hypothetical protein VFB43_12070 [Terracidiphilus sp.]|nr:hypothetical protein [Terracidiphilus sp.]